MNYLEPFNVVDAVITKLLENRSGFFYKQCSVNSIAEIAKIPGADGEDHGLKPPWLGVYYSLDLDGDVMSDGSPDDTPVTIGVLCASSPGYKSETESLREAMVYARQVIDVVIGQYVINAGTDTEPDEKLVFLQTHEQPREIMLASAELSLVAVRFKYYDRYQ
ncbi:MAG: hypothetical protein KKB34_10250 [Bacteroidetes bacterium]|nr:hypothetical protein [Bacteroidota bacterium]